MACAFINDLVDEWHQIIIFGTHGIEVMIISANTDNTLFFVNWDEVGYPRCVLDWVDEANAKKFVDLSFNRWGFCWV